MTAQAGRARHRLGQGQDLGRGGKGQKARTGVALNGFEGGQMPLYRRLPKRGFNNTISSNDFVDVNLGRLQQAIEAGKLDAERADRRAALVAAGVLRRAARRRAAAGQGRAEGAS